MFEKYKDVRNNILYNRGDLSLNFLISNLNSQKVELNLRDKGHTNFKSLMACSSLKRKSNGQWIVQGLDL